MPWVAAIPAIIGAIGIADNMWGSGKKSREMQRDALALQQTLANEQLADSQRQRYLSEFLEKYFKGGLENAEGSLPPMINVDGGISDYLKKNGFSPFDESTLTPWAEGNVRTNMLQGLMGLTGNLGTGGIAGNAQNATALGVRSQDQFQQTVSGIVEMLMKSKQAAPVGSGSGFNYGFQPNPGAAANSAFTNQMAMGLNPFGR